MPVYVAIYKCQACGELFEWLYNKSLSVSLTDVETLSRWIHIKGDKEENVSIANQTPSYRKVETHRCDALDGGVGVGVFSGFRRLDS